MIGKLCNRQVWQVYVQVKQEKVILKDGELFPSWIQDLFPYFESLTTLSLKHREQLFLHRINYDSRLKTKFLNRQFFGYH